MPTFQQPADDPVIHAEGEVIGKDAPIPDDQRQPVADHVATPNRTIRFLAAIAIAALADVTQLVLLPLFGEGVASPLNDALDVIVAFFMIALLGFHWQFLPSFVSELVPILNIAPAWTIAVLWVHRSERQIAD